MQSTHRNENRRILVIDDQRAIHEEFRKILGAGPADAKVWVEGGEPGAGQQACCACARHFKNGAASDMNVQSEIRRSDFVEISIAENWRHCEDAPSTAFATV
jgi:hypothetical protein